MSSIASSGAFPLSAGEAGTEAGFVGWISAGGLPGTSYGAPPLWSRMASRLAPSAGTTRVAGMEAAEAALGGAFVDPACFHGANGRWAAIDGAPRWRDGALNELSHREGHGAALLAAFDRYGEDLLRHIHGSFALALVDPGRKKVFLATDRAGGLPIFVTSLEGGGLAFSTNMDALLVHPKVSDLISRQSLLDYFHFSVVPGPRTIYAGVEKLLPAERISYDDGRVEKSVYWRMPYQTRTRMGEAEAERELVSTLRGAVARSLADSDGRRIGAFLSGGLDSSSILGLATEVNGPLDSFTIGFDSEAFDESAYADIASRHFGSRHRHHALTPEDMLDAIPRLAAAYDEPFGNSSAVAALVCARMAREAGIGTMLAGDGGDELFAGNERYVLQQKFELYHSVPAPVRSLLEFALTAVPADARIGPARKLAGYIRRSKTPMPQRMESYNFLHQEALDAVFSREFLSHVERSGPAERLDEVWQRCVSPSLLQRMMHYDLHVILADNDLRKVTRTCSMEGIHVRFPMMDETVMEFSAALPPEILTRHLRLRAFYKKAFGDFLPAEIIRKKKHGFGLPFRVWASRTPAVREYLAAVLHRFGTRGIVRRDLLDRLIQQWDSEEARAYGQFVWYMVMLEEWLQNRQPSFAI